MCMKEQHRWMMALDGADGGALWRTSCRHRVLIAVQRGECSKPLQLLKPFWVYGATVSPQKPVIPKPRKLSNPTPKPLAS